MIFSAPAPVSAEQVTSGTPLYLGERGLQPVRDGSARRGTVSHQIPLVEQDDEGPAFVRHTGGDGHVLSASGIGGVEHGEHHRRLAKGALGVPRRELVERLHGLGPAAHARGIHQIDRPALVGPAHRDRIPRESRLGAGDDTRLAHQPIEQRRLADIGAAHDGKPEHVGRAGCGGTLRRLGVEGAQRVVEVCEALPCSAEIGIGCPSPRA